MPCCGLPAKRSTSSPVDSLKKDLPITDVMAKRSLDQLSVTQILLILKRRQQGDQRGSC